MGESMKYGGENGFGCRQNPSPPRVAPLGELIGDRNAIVIPAWKSLRQFVPGTFGQSPATSQFYVDWLNQATTSTCVGHAVTGAIYTRMAAQGTPIKLPSPPGNYTLARAKERKEARLTELRAKYPSQPIDMAMYRALGPLPSLVDIGTEPFWSMASLTDDGCPPFDLWGNFPVNPATINNEPTAKQLEAASAFKMNGFYRIATTGEERMQDVLAAVTLDRPVCMARHMGPWFNHYTGGILGAPQEGDTLGHYIYVDGFTWDEKNARSLVLDCINSFGRDWGMDGCLLANYDFLCSAFDIYVMDVRSAA